MGFINVFSKSDMRIRIFPQIVILLIIVFLPKYEAIAIDHAGVLEQFLQSDDLKEQRHAYNQILENPSIYVNIIQDKLGNLN
ncbi:MAG: hypothetical protein ACOZBW_11175, partial [Thermodesulfobacteriota bacterium]